MRRSYWPAEPLRPGNSPGFKSSSHGLQYGQAARRADFANDFNLTARIA
jgi:hypothetical protein